MRINKNKIKKYKIQGKVIGDLARGKDVRWKGQKIKAKEVTYKQQGKIITIIMDTAFNKNCYKIARNANLLISEAVYAESESKLAKEYKHLTAKQAGIIAKKAKVKKLIITHLSQRYDQKGSPIFNEARKVFKKVGIAEDLDKIEV
jgi:ribonuclease Z